MSHLDGTHPPGLFLVSLPAPPHHISSSLVINKEALPDLCSFFLLSALPQGWTFGLPDSAVDLGVYPRLCCWLVVGLF